MTDDDPSSSSWNFDDYHREDQSNSSTDFFSVLKKNVAQHVYRDEELKDTNPNCSHERSTTVHVDGSELISRCKQFLPLLTDANRTLFSQIHSGENVRIELDSDQEDERRIEMNLMFCPDVDSSSQSETSTDDDDDDDPIQSTLLQLPKKNKSIQIVEIPIEDNEKLEDDNVND